MNQRKKARGRTAKVLTAATLAAAPASVLAPLWMAPDEHRAQASIFDITYLGGLDRIVLDPDDDAELVDLSSFFTAESGSFSFSINDPLTDIGTAVLISSLLLEITPSATEGTDTITIEVNNFDQYYYHDIEIVTNQRPEDVDGDSYDVVEGGTLSIGYDSLFSHGTDLVGLSADAADPSVVDAVYGSGGLTIQGLQLGATTVTMSVYDGYYEESGGFDVNVIENVGPVWSVIEDIEFDLSTEPPPSQSVELSEFVSAAQPGETYTYVSLDTDSPILPTLIEGGTLVIFRSNEPAADTVEIEVSDGVHTSLVEIDVRVGVPPEQAYQFPSDIVIETGIPYELDLADYFIDVDSESLTYEVALDSETTYATATVNGSLLQVTGEMAGTYTMTITATDSEGFQVTGTLEVGVNTPIELASNGNTVMLDGEFAEVSLDDIFYDPDVNFGQSINYTFEAFENEVILNCPILYESDRILSLSTDGVGTAAITISAEDEFGSASEDTIYVTSMPDQSLQMTQGIQDKKMYTELFSYFDVNSYFTHTDSVEYTVQEVGTNLLEHVGMMDGEIFVIAGTTPGVATIEVTASAEGQLDITTRFDVHLHDVDEVRQLLQQLNPNVQERIHLQDVARFLMNVEDPELKDVNFDGVFDRMDVLELMRLIDSYFYND